MPWKLEALLVVPLSNSTWPSTSKDVDQNHVGDPCIKPLLTETKIRKHGFDSSLLAFHLLVLTFHPPVSLGWAQTGENRTVSEVV